MSSVIIKSDTMIGHFVCVFFLFPDPCDPDPCDPNAICAEAPGTDPGFTCTCIPPFVGDGFVCRSKFNWSTGGGGDFSSDCMLFASLHQGSS